MLTMTARQNGDATQRTTLVGNPLKIIFPNGYELVPQLNEVYELILAYSETQALDDGELIRRGAYFKSVNEVPTVHFQTCLGKPLKVASASSLRLRSFFETNQFKTGYATHGLFPYRGKFHPQMIRALINVIGVETGETILDPMMGSGTVPIEAAIMGLDSIGVDISPFCRFMAQAKYDGLLIKTKQIKSRIILLKKLFNDLRTHAAEISSPVFAKTRKPLVTDDPHADMFLALCYYDALGYAARVTSKDHEELFAELLEKYLTVADKFWTVKTSLDLDLGEADLREGDSRKLDIKSNSIGGCIFSPPYSFAIDYAENDEDQLKLMGINVSELRETMIGLRGGKSAERVDLYFDDMTQTMSEIHRVLKPHRYCVIVVGSNTSQLKTILKTEDPDSISIENRLIHIGDKIGLKFAEKMTRQVTGIRNVMRDEYILFFEKS